MIVEQTIRQRLEDAFQPEHLEVVNESHQHSVPVNSETHFKVVLVSAAFDGSRKVARHQKVYAQLAEELAGPVHALALHTYTPAEWQQRNAAAPDSPDCLGGSKREQQETGNA
jgi:BolA protein